jgi:hypothetical protein
MVRHERTLGSYRVPDARRVSGWFRSMAIPRRSFPEWGKLGTVGIAVAVMRTAALPHIRVGAGTD